jgi:hypothetical protein
MTPLGHNPRNPRNWAPRGHSRDAEFVKNAAARQDLLALCTAMADWLEHHSPKPPFSLIAAAFMHNSRVVSPIAAGALGVLLEDELDASQRVSSVFRSVPAHPRMMIIRFVANPRLHPAATETLVRAGLSDRSRHVRVEAAMKIAEFRLKRYLPDLVALRSAELDAGTRSLLDECVDVTDHDYHAVQLFDIASWRITFIEPGSRHIQFRSAAQVASEGLDQVVSAARLNSLP